MGGGFRWGTLTGLSPAFVQSNVIKNKNSIPNFVAIGCVVLNKKKQINLNILMKTANYNSIYF